MKFIKGLLITLLALLLVYVILALFSPTSTYIERNIEISAPAEKVWSEISDFKNWENWSPWIQDDSTTNNIFTEKDGAISSKMSWTNDNLDVESIEIIETISNKKLVVKLTLIEPWESSSEDSFILIEKEGKTILSWSDYREFSFFLRPIMFFMGMNSETMDSMMGPDFEKGLKNIKKIVESSIDLIKPINITQVDLPSSNYLGIRHKAKMSEVMNANFFSVNYSKIMEALEINKLTQLGAPITIYYSWNKVDSTTELVPAIPVSELIDSKLNGIEYIVLPAAKVVKAAYYGEYEDSEQAHYKLEEYCKTKGIETGLVVEEYVNDPTKVSSPNEILTNIYYYIK